MRYALAAFLIFIASPAQATEPLKVTASFSILADIAQVVGGQHVNVVSLVGPGADAHMFEPAPMDAARVAEADIILINGLGFEGWIGRLVEASAAKGLLVTASEGIKVMEADDHGHSHGHSHGHEADPHAWQDPRNGIIYARNIAEGLCRKDSANCETFRANASRYAGELTALDAEIRANFANIPQAARRVITSHDAFGYFGKAYGIRFMAARGVSSDAEPSAKGIAQLISQIKKERAKALFVETVSDPRLIERIAADAGITPSGKIYSDALSPPGGPADSYIAMLRYNAGMISAALLQESQ